MALSHVVYTTSLKPPEVVNLLKKHVEDGDFSPINLMLRCTDKPYYGSITSQSFKIMKSFEFWNRGLSPIVTAEIRETQTGSEIFVNFKLRTIELISPLIAFCVLIYFFFLKPFFTDPNFEATITPFIIVGIMLLLGINKFGKKCKRAKLFLLDVWNKK